MLVDLLFFTMLSPFTTEFVKNLVIVNFVSIIVRFVYRICLGLFHLWYMCVLWKTYACIFLIDKVTQ